MIVTIDLMELGAWIATLVGLSIMKVVIDEILNTRPRSERPLHRTISAAVAYGIGGILAILFLRIMGMEIF